MLVCLKCCSTVWLVEDSHRDRELQDASREMGTLSHWQRMLVIFFFRWEREREPHIFAAPRRGCRRPCAHGEGPDMSLSTGEVTDGRRIAGDWRQRGCHGAGRLRNP